MAGSTSSRMPDSIYIFEFLLEEKEDISVYGIIVERVLLCINTRILIFK